MSDKPVNSSKPQHGLPSQKIRTPIRWAIAAISLAFAAIACIDIRFQDDLAQAYFRGRPVGTLAADYATLIASIYLGFVALFGRWLLFSGRK